MKEKYSEAEDLEVHVYSNGVCFCSVCAPKSMKQKDVEKNVNIMNPTGTTWKWKINKKKTFNNGEKNGCDCNKLPNERRHFLLNC